jgi:hypothetical protein
MTLTSKPLAVLVVLILFGGILLSSSLGAWNTVSSKEAAKFSTGEFAGQANPADIRGSYTFGDIEKNFGIPTDELVKAFGIQTNDAAAFQVKELETIFAENPVEIGTSSVRLFVAFYKGLPIDLSTDIYLPGMAVDLLKDKPLTAQQISYLETHTAGNVPAVDLSVATAVATVTPTTAATATFEHLIKGLTTFNDLLSWGLDKATIEKITGLALPSDLAMKIKDYASANNLNFEILKPALQSAVDNLK